MENASVGVFESAPSTPCRANVIFVIYRIASFGERIPSEWTTSDFGVVFRWMAVKVDKADGRSTVDLRIGFPISVFIGL